MSDMDCYFLEKDNSNSGLLELGKCSVSDENAAETNEFSSSLSSEAPPSCSPDDGSNRRDDEKFSQDTVDASEDREEQTVESSSDNQVGFADVHSGTGSLETKEGIDGLTKKDSSGCVDTTFKDIIDMNSGDSEHSEGEPSGIAQSVTVDKEETMQNDCGEMLPNQSVAPALDESTKILLDSNDESNCKNDKSLDDILDNFCDENSKIAASLESSESVTSNADTSEAPVISDDYSVSKKQTYEGNESHVQVAHLGELEIDPEEEIERMDVESGNIAWEKNAKVLKDDENEVQEMDYDDNNDHHVQDIENEHTSDKEMTHEEITVPTEAIVSGFVEEIDDASEYQVKENLDTELKEGRDMGAEEKTDGLKEVVEPEIVPQNMYICGESSVSAEDKEEVVESEALSKDTAILKEAVGSETLSMTGTESEETDRQTEVIETEIVGPETLSVMETESEEIDGPTEIIETEIVGPETLSVMETESEEMDGPTEVVETEIVGPETLSVMGTESEETEVVETEIVGPETLSVMGTESEETDEPTEVVETEIVGTETLSVMGTESEETDGPTEVIETEIIPQRMYLCGESIVSAEDKEVSEVLASETMSEMYTCEEDSMGYNEEETITGALEEDKNVSREKENGKNEESCPPENEMKENAKEIKKTHVGNMGQQSENSTEGEEHISNSSDHREVDHNALNRLESEPVETRADVSKELSKEERGNYEIKQTEPDQEVIKTFEESNEDQNMNVSSELSSGKQDTIMKEDRLRTKEIFEGNFDDAEGDLKTDKQSDANHSKDLQEYKRTESNTASEEEAVTDGKDDTDDPYIDFDEENIENISRTIQSFANEKMPLKKKEDQSKKAVVVKFAPNVERVKRKLEEILEKSKDEEDAAISELQRMKREKTDILNAITTEMEKLKSMLVKGKQG